MGGVFQKFMPKQVSGFEGFTSLDLIKDAGLALFLDLGEDFVKSFNSLGEFCWRDDGSRTGSTV